MQPLARARPQRVRIVQARIGTDEIRKILIEPRRGVRLDERARSGMVGKAE